MPNRVYLSTDGFIHNRHVGDQTGESVGLMVAQIADIAASLKAKQRPVLALIDLTKLGKQDTSARQAAAEGLKTLGYDRAAIYGSNPILRYIVGLVIRASGKGATTGYFESKAEAVAFLKQGRKQVG